MPARRRVPAVAVALVAAALMGALAWWRQPAARRLRAVAVVAATPGWIGQATLSGPDFDVSLTVHWQRPGWWRVETAGGGETAYDGQHLTVRLAGFPAQALGADPSTAWQILWPAVALRRPGPVALDTSGWPVAWRAGGLRVAYTRVTPVPLLPRADFRVAGAAPVVRAGVTGFTPRPAPGLRPLWTAAYTLPDVGPVAVFQYRLAAGTLTLAEQPGSCPSADPVWVRTTGGWIAHWCAPGLQFTADGSGDRTTIDQVVRSLR